MRTLTGLQPSGALHIGNYFGSLQQMLAAQETQESFIFIANYHAMTSLSDGAKLRQNTLDAAAAFLALGIDPNKSVFWAQSDVSEVLEVYWILSQFTPMGLLERAHAYKDKLAKGASASHGLFSYPVLMAADILLYNAQSVPVGKDQIQHVEIARDIALKFNAAYGEVFTLPQAKVEENLTTIPGTDGAKMSKSYGNTIDIFASSKQLKKQCNAIVSDSTPLEEPKQWRNCNIFALAKLFLNEAGQEELKARYERGGEGHGHFKAYLCELIDEFFAPAREKFAYFQTHPDEVLQILEFGAAKARTAAKETLEKVRAAAGILR